MWRSTVAAILCGCCIVCAVPASNKPVSNEDIRDAILSIVHMMRGLEDKLDRHEFRERALGNDLKKSFATLDKRVKALESVKGLTQRLDERVANVETILMMRDERERTAMQTTAAAIDEMRAQQLPALTDKLANVSAEVGRLGEGFGAASKTIAGAMEHVERSRAQLSSSEMLLAQYEHKLAEFNDSAHHMEIVPIDNYRDSPVHQALDEHKTQLAALMQNVTALTTQVASLPQRIANETLPLVASLTPALDNLTRTIVAGHAELKHDVGALPKVEEILVQTAEGLLDTKRRVEYGVHAITLEVKHLIKEHGDKMNATVRDRFDAFELNILDGETGALANLTSKIGADIDQVWRQIGIMHQQMGASTDTLNKLQNQTDAYVSGSLDIMDSMKGKVAAITGRMTEMDENLNYLMGRLSLVTQEFNNIKGGLGAALDEIRASFTTVKQHIAAPTGPGPHQIPASGEEPQHSTAATAASA